jgi:hypothetical protein
MEKLVKKAMLTHLTKYSLINEQQHGFVRLKSCVTNLLECLDIITQAINQGALVDLIFLDFAKAFDKVWHRGLIFKLEALGFNGEILKWIESFLTGKRQRVVIGEITSEWKNVIDYTMEIFGNDERHKLEETQVERDLGIQLSDDLKWHTQAITAANKANSVLGINEQLSIGMKIFASSCTSLMYVRILSTQHQRGTHIE